MCICSRMELELCLSEVVVEIEHCVSFLSTCTISIHAEIWRSYVSILTNPLKYKL
jgi:hypothetical protein